MREGGSQMEPERGGHQPEKGTRLFTYLILGVIVLVIFGAFTLFQRRAQYHALAGEHGSAGHSYRGGYSSYFGGRAGRPRATRHDAGLRGIAHLCSHQRIPTEVVSRYRNARAKGELLADIDTPEVDQQLLQARADLNTAQANANLSKITSTRYQELIKTDGVSKQEVDNAVGDYEAKAATMQSFAANVRSASRNWNRLNMFTPHSAASSLAAI